MIVDWHNTTAAMLALRLHSIGRSAPVLVALASRCEAWLGRRARAHLCVTNAMRTMLARDAGIEAALLPDLPPERFRPLSATERQHFTERYASLFGSREGDRPAVVVSPCGWTADDDFALLVAALRKWDAMLSERDPACSRPRALFLLTGDGERRREAGVQLASTSFRCLSVHTHWFASDDYPFMLASADLGLSLHRSASGVDLPIKLSEMLGSGLPVCSLDYGEVLRERIDDGVNGVLFSTADGLASLLGELLDTFPDAPRLSRMRSAVAAGRPERWEEAWTRVAAPLIGALAGSRSAA